MSSFRQQLSCKVEAFLYDHQAIPLKGKKLRRSYKEVEKFVQSIGKAEKRK